MKNSDQRRDKSPKGDSDKGDNSSLSSSTSQGTAGTGRQRLSESTIQTTNSTSTSSSTPTHPPWQIENSFKQMALQHGQERLLPIGNSRQSKIGFLFPLYLYLYQSHLEAAVPLIYFSFQKIFLFQKWIERHYWTLNPCKVLKEKKVIKKCKPFNL